MKIDIPPWYGHEYLNAVKLFRALLQGEHGEREIAAIKAEIATHHPNWNRYLLDHIDSVISELERVV
jgi:hypothetical protein